LSGLTDHRTMASSVAATTTNKIENYTTPWDAARGEEPALLSGDGRGPRGGRRRLHGNTLCPANSAAGSGCGQRFAELGTRFAEQSHEVSGTYSAANLVGLGRGGAEGRGEERGRETRRDNC